MRVLFVCRENRGRGQMAMAFYNQLHPGMAASAGTVVSNQKLKLGELIPKSKTVELMREVGIDVSNNGRMRITRDMLAVYDKIIVMSEPNNTPSRLRDNPKTEIWEMEDTKGKTMSKSRHIRDKIKTRVDELDRRLNAKS